jgi:phosphoribosylformylglycinamidine synthase
VFLNNIEQMYLPIAHAEGKFVPRNEQVLDQLKNDHQLALSYCLADGSDNEVTYPHNPNGSEAAAASLCNDSGRVTIMMPHPERVFRAVQNSWHPNEWNERSPWMRMFENARKWVD